MNDPRCFLFLHNITKESNQGFLIRTASAFAAELIVIGRKRYGTSGAAGGTRHTPVHHFYSLREGVAFARDQGARILGIEILDEARPIESHPFTGPTAFLPGNEGEGLLECHLEVCDDFVYVPQYGEAVCLNVNVATAICLHHFGLWAGFAETRREGRKFHCERKAVPAHRRPGS